MSARSRQREADARDQIRANLTRPFHPAAAVLPAPQPSGEWTPWRALADDQNRETRKAGRRAKNVSPTHVPAYPYNRRTT